MNDTGATRRADAMTSVERRAAAGLAAIMASRMLGLFLILPIFALYAPELSGATPTLIGLAIGAYGLSQALLQIPMGAASDRWGRQPVIVAGLLLFVAGSAVAALSEHIYGVIAGRLLQGAGAISAAVMALAADLTRESQRTKIMASLGVSIGGSFMLAMVLGPLLAGWIGLSGVFWSMALLAVAAIAARASQGLVVGVDRSQVMIRQASRRNRAAIKAGRVRLMHAPVERLAIGDGRFDAALAVNTVGMWPDPAARLREIARLLRPGGRIALVSQPRCPGATAATSAAAAHELSGLLTEAGFAHLRTETLDLNPPAVCVLGRVPGADIDPPSPIAH